MKEPAPPSGAITPPKPLGNQSPLGIASADPRPTPSDERPLIPPRTDGTASPPEIDADQNTFPPFRKRFPEPKLPSPFVPKTPNTEALIAKSLAELKAVLAVASAAWKALDTFEGTLTRREISPQGTATNEVVLFQFRKEPMSVYTRTTGENGKGREMIYSPGKHGDKLHLALGQGDAKLIRAGTVLPALSPDDPRVKEKARHSIRDAGFGKNLAKLADMLAKIEAGKLPSDTLTFHGPVKRDEYPYPLVAITHNLRVEDDPLFPKGGSRTFFFDPNEKSPSYGLPVLVVATDATGKEAEYYLFEKVKSPAKLTDADFNPDRLGKK